MPHIMDFLIFSEILDTYPKGSKLQSKVKLNIWKLGLIKVALTSLKQDFGQILNGWNLASKVASIVWYV